MSASLTCGQVILASQRRKQKYSQTLGAYIWVRHSYVSRAVYGSIRNLQPSRGYEAFIKQVNCNCQLTVISAFSGARGWTDAVSRTVFLSPDRLTSQFSDLDPCAQGLGFQAFTDLLMSATARFYGENYQTDKLLVKTRKFIQTLMVGPQLEYLMKIQNANECRASRGGLPSPVHCLYRVCFCFA